MASRGSIVATVVFTTLFAQTVAPCAAIAETPMTLQGTASQLKKLTKGFHTPGPVRQTYNVVTAVVAGVAAIALFATAFQFGRMHEHSPSLRKQHAPVVKRLDAATRGIESFVMRHVEKHLSPAMRGAYKGQYRPWAQPRQRTQNSGR